MSNPIPQDLHRSSTDSDVKTSGSKTKPLESNVKTGEPSAESSGGSAVTDQTVDQARLEPMGGAGQYKNPASHADDHGSVGRDADIAAAKIDPLIAQAESPNTARISELRDEDLDASRIEPMGTVSRN